MGTVKPKLNSYEVDFKPSSILSVCDDKGTGSNKIDKSNLKQHTSLKEIGLKIVKWQKFYLQTGWSCA